MPSGASKNDDHLYVMINAYWEPLTFTIQQGTVREWLRIVDTGQPSPDDFSDHGVPVDQMSYEVSPRSIVVFTRAQKGGR